MLNRGSARSKAAAVWLVVLGYNGCLPASHGLCPAGALHGPLNSSRRAAVSDRRGQPATTGMRLGVPSGFDGGGSGTPSKTVLNTLAVQPGGRSRAAATTEVRRNARGGGGLRLAVVAAPADPSRLLAVQNAAAEQVTREEDYGILFRGTETLFRFCSPPEPVISAGRFKEGG